MKPEFKEDFTYLITALEEGYIFRQAKEVALGEPLAAVADRHEAGIAAVDS